MSEEKPVVSAKDAVEAVLASRLAEDPEFLSALAADPDAVVKPIIAEVIGDDGEIDMSELTTVVNIDSPNRLHFSIPMPESEVAGYARMAMGLDLRSFQVRRPSLGAKSQLDTASALCACPSEDCSTGPVFCPEKVR